MTTIAWDGKTLAADKRKISVLNASTVKTTIVTKIHRLSDGRLIGSAGHAYTGLIWKNWLERPIDGHDDYLLHIEKYGKDITMTGLEISPSGLVTIYRNNKITQIGNNVIAIGSGWKYALGVLHAGLSSFKAVEIASKLDKNTGDGIDILEFI